MRQAIILAALLLVALGVYTIIPKPEAVPYDANSVKQFVLEDARSEYPAASIEVLAAEKIGSTWQVDVKIARDAHSKCPKLIKRYYTFPPMYFREEVLNDRCAAGGQIVFPEEAILASAGVQAVKNLPDSVEANARLYSAEEIGALQECISCSQFEEFSKALGRQKTWIVSWTYGGSVLYVALDGNGNVLATS